MTNLEDLIALSTSELIARVPDFTAADRARLRDAAAQEWHRFAYGDAATDLPREEYQRRRHHRSLIVMATARVGQAYWPLDGDSMEVAEARGSRVRACVGTPRVTQRRQLDRRALRPYPCL